MTKKPYETPRILFHAEREANGDWYLFRMMASRSPTTAELDRMWAEGTEESCDS